MDLITYIHSCIKPVNKSEYISSYLFDKNVYNNLIQDGFYVCKHIIDSDKQYLTDYIQLGEYYIIRKVIKEITWLNDDGTYTWYNETESKIPIYKRLIPPPIETVNHTYIINIIMNHVLERVKTPTYIEYGIRWGENFKCISSLNKNGKNIGVDLDISHMETHKSYLNENNIHNEFYKMNTDDFSEQILPKCRPHIAFIDADHYSLSVIKDFQNIFMYLQPGGYIILHDTYPCSEEFLSKNGSYDCYKVPLYIKEKYIKEKYIKEQKLEILTLPLNPGVTIVHKLY